jgi:hypothetical protein
VDHAVWGSVRIRIHEDGVDDAEDRGGGADAKGEGKDGCESESGMVAELAEGEAEIGKHGQSSPVGAMARSTPIGEEGKSFSFQEKQFVLQGSFCPVLRGGVRQ